VSFKVGDTLPSLETQFYFTPLTLTLSVFYYLNNKEYADWRAYLEAHNPTAKPLGFVVDL
jgi:hypothetical protein